MIRDEGLAGSLDSTPERVTHGQNVSSEIGASAAMSAQARMGGELFAAEALGCMTDHDVSPTADALDALVHQLLACGGSLSQIVGRMQEVEASGLSSPDAPSILEVAHSLIRDVNAGLPERYTEQEIRVAAAIVEDVSTAICENIFFIPPSEIRRMSRSSPSAGGRKRQRRSGRRPR